MDLLFRLFYCPAGFLYLGHPGRAAAVLGCLVVAGVLVAVRLKRHWHCAWPLLLPTVAWALVVWGEAEFAAEIARDPRACELRVDILFVWPVLLLITILGAYSVVYNVRRIRKRGNTTPPSEPH